MGDLSPSPQSQPSRVDTLIYETEAEPDAVKARKHLEERMQALSLNDQEQQELREGVERSVVLQKNSELLASVRQRVERKEAPVEQQSEVSPEPVKAPETPTKIVEKKFWNPATWTPEERTKAAQIAVVGGAVVGGVLLLRWLGQKIKAGIDTAKEKTESAWGFLKTAAIVAGLTALGYFGWRGYTKYKETFDKVRAIDKKIEGLKKDALALAGDAKAAAEVEIARLEEIRKNIEKGPIASPDTPDPETKPEEPSPVEDVIEQGKKDVQETQEIVTEKTSDIIVIKCILASVDHSSWTLPEDAKEYQLGGIFLNNSDLKMADFYAKVEAGQGAKEILKIVDTDVANRKKSSEIMFQFCTENRETVIQYLMRRKSVDRNTAESEMLNMPLPDFARTAVIGQSGAIEAIKALVDSKEGIVERFQKIDLHSIAQGSEAMHQELRDFVDENKVELGLDKDTPIEADPASILKVMIGTGTGTVANHMMKFEDNGTKNIEEKIIRAVFEKLKTGDTHLYLLPLFHGIFPTKDGETDAERVKTYMLDRMSPDQALRIYMYRRMMDRGYSAGIVMMQLEAIKFVAGQDEGFLGEKKYEIILRMGRKMTGKTSEQLAEEWEKLGIKLDYPEMFDVSAKSLTMVGGGIVYGFGKLTQENFGFLTALAKQETALTLGSALVASEVVPRLLLNNFVTTEGIREGLQNWARLANKPDWLNRSSNIARQVALGPSADNIVRASQEFNGICHVVDAIKPGNPAYSEITKLSNSCIATPKSPSVWRALSAKLLSAGFKDAAASADAFAASAGMRNAVYIERYAFLKGGPLAIASGYRKYLRVYDAGKAIATEGAVQTGKALEAMKNSTLIQKSFEQLETAITAARKMGDNKKLLELLQNPIIQKMADLGNKAARSLKNVWKLVAPGAKWAGKASIVAGPLIDVAFLIGNSWELEEARKNGNIEKQQILEAKRQTLSVAGLAGAYIVGNNPAALLAAPIAIPAIIAGTIYANAIYDDIIKWEKTSGEWLNESPEELRKKLNTITYGKSSIGTRTAYGTTVVRDIWNHLPLVGKSKEQLDQEEADNVNKNEGVNVHMRMEILTAYFIKTKKMHRLPNETDEQFQAKAKLMIQDCLSFIRRSTGGTYDGNNVSDYIFEQARDYADLRATRRAQNSGELRYQHENEDRALDLHTLDYVSDDSQNNIDARSKFLHMMHQYQTELKLQKEAVEDLYRMEAPLA